MIETLNKYKNTVDGFVKSHDFFTSNKTRTNKSVCIERIINFKIFRLYVNEKSCLIVISDLETHILFITLLFYENTRKFTVRRFRKTFDSRTHCTLYNTLYSIKIFFVISGFQPNVYKIYRHVCSGYSVFSKKNVGTIYNYIFMIFRFPKT